jgi:hypothetical protein
MTVTEGDDRTESSLYDYFHVTCLRWAIGLEGAIVREDNSGINS